MEEADRFSKRVWDAYKELEKREGRVSQEKLAQRIEALGGHPTRQDDVSRWFREVSRPSYEELPAVAEVLGVSLMWLAFGIGQMEEGSAVPSRPAIPLNERRVPRVRKAPVKRKGTK